MPRDNRLTRSALVIGAAMWIALLGFVSACSRDVDAFTPQQLQQQYGITGAYTGQMAMPDGTIQGTLVPVAMPDGHKGILIIPADGSPAYFRDEQGVHGIEVDSAATRDQVVASPVIVTRRVAPPHKHTRSWQKELLIIGGSAGAGAAVGGLTGGKKGAGIGAAAGGVGGLIYDLATRKNP